MKGLETQLRGEEKRMWAAISARTAEAPTPPMMRPAFRTITIPKESAAATAVRIPLIVRPPEEPFISKPIPIPFADIPRQDRNLARKRIAAQAMLLHQSAPERALEHLKSLATDPNAIVRASVVRALAGIGTPETWELLLGLAGDTDMDVKREALKSLKMIQKESDGGPPEWRERIDQAMRIELEKGDWVF